MLEEGIAARFLSRLIWRLVALNRGAKWAGNRSYTILSCGHLLRLEVVNRNVPKRPVLPLYAPKHNGVQRQQEAGLDPRRKPWRLLADLNTSSQVAPLLTFNLLG
jgi:hypothetical protein